MARSGSGGHCVRSTNSLGNAIWGTYSYAFFVLGAAIPAATGFHDAFNLRSTGTGSNPDQGFRWDATTLGATKTANHRAASNAYSSVQLASAISASLFHHIAVTYDGSNLRIYLDGALDNTTGSVPTPGVVISPFAHILAQDAGGVTPNQWAGGTMAEVAVWPSAVLDADEVASLAKGFSPSLVRPQGLRFYAPLVRDEADGVLGGGLTNTGTPVYADHPRRFG